MRTTAAIVAASALATVAVAKPLPHAPTYQRKGFSINQSVKVPGRSGAAHLAKAYAKYGQPVPDNIVAATQGDGSVVATPEEYDVEYLCPVSVGGQVLNLDFDTGSSDLWVFSSELPSTQSKGHSIYNPSKSNSSKKVSGATWKISYGDGSGASGDVYTDTVTIGGTTVTGQAVEPAATISAQFQQDVNNDGLVGLAFSSINTVQPKQQTTFFDSAIAQKALQANVFTVDLKKGEPGTYDFGFVDDNKYTGEITYTDVDSSEGFWTFNSEVDGTPITGIADTGTTLMLLDDTVVEAYYQQVDGAENDQQQGGYVFDCEAQLPDFVVTVEGAEFTVPGSFLNLSPVTEGSSTCFGGLQSSSGIGTNIYGDVFLKAVFAVFDSEGPRLGLAAKDL